MAYLEDVFEIGDRAYDDYLKLVDSHKNNFVKLFVTFTKQGNPKKSEKDANRYVIGGEHCNLVQWNNIY